MIEFKHCPTCNVDHFASSKCARHEAHCKNLPVYRCEHCQKYHSVAAGCPNTFALKARARPQPQTEFETELAKHAERMSRIGTDEVNHPEHYTHGSIECIDAIQAALTPEEFRGYLKGNIIKYIWRERLKKGVGKAQWYINKMVEVFGG